MEKYRNNLATPLKGWEDEVYEIAKEYINFNRYLSKLERYVYWKWGEKRVTILLEFTLILNLEFCNEINIFFFRLFFEDLAKNIRLVDSFKYYFAISWNETYVQRERERRRSSCNQGKWRRNGDIASWVYYYCLDTATLFSITLREKKTPIIDSYIRRLSWVDKSVNCFTRVWKVSKIK